MKAEYPFPLSDEVFEKGRKMIDMFWRTCAQHQPEGCDDLAAIVLVAKEAIRRLDEATRGGQELALERVRREHEQKTTDTVRAELERLEKVLATSEGDRERLRNQLRQTDQDSFSRLHLLDSLREQLHTADAALLVISNEHDDDCTCVACDYWNKLTDKADQS